MNRRDFVKSLGVMAAASFVPVAYAAKSESELEYYVSMGETDQIHKMLDMIKDVDSKLVENGFRHLGFMEIDDLYEVDMVPNDGGGYRSTLKNGPVKFKITGNEFSTYLGNNIYHGMSNPEDVLAYFGKDSSLKLLHYIREFDIRSSPTPMVVSRFSGLRISKIKPSLMQLEDRYIFDMYTIG
jgi:hypothetical protein